MTSQQALIHNNNEIKDKKLQLYLKSIEWDKKEFLNDKLSVMLVASCLRYLEGLADISFVLDLSAEIKRKHENCMNTELNVATNILHYAGERLKNKNITANDTHAIANWVDIAQKALTTKNYLPVS